MRKISEQAAKAFIEGRKFRSKNTDVDGDGLRLHGHLIARRASHGVEINFQGWPTPTTKERLNTVLSVLGVPGGFHTVNGELCRDGKTIPGNEWVTVCSNPHKTAQN